MEKISCSIVKDLLPLYIDGILRKETEETVKAHLESCDACRKDYEVMTRELTMLSAPEVQEESKKTFIALKRRLRRRRILSAMIAAVITAVIVISVVLVYMNVEPVQDFFTQDIMVVIRDGETADVWTPVYIEENGYLTFDHLFCKKTVSLDANSDSGVMLRFLDTEGNVVLDSVSVLPGEKVSLKTLKKGTHYYVEMQTDGTDIFLRFN